MAHQQFAECIEACYACADACDHCAVACLAEDDPKMMARCIELVIQEAFEPHGVGVDLRSRVLLDARAAGLAVAGIAV
jgi:predicted GNAT family acetyltransferase